MIGEEVRGCSSDPRSVDITAVINEIVIELGSEGFIGGPRIRVVVEVQCAAVDVGVSDDLRVDRGLVAGSLVS